MHRRCHHLQYSEEWEQWEQHLEIIREFFKRLSDVKLTINLPKSVFCHANLTFLGHIVGQGQVRPVEAKVKAISNFPVPIGKRQLVRFLGMAGYYRKFCNNFSVIAEGTSRQGSGKGAIRKRFPLQKPRWEKTKLTIR